MNKKLSYAFVMEVEDEPLKVVLAFSKERVAEVLERIYEGDMKKALDKLEAAIASEVRNQI